MGDTISRRAWIKSVSAAAAIGTVRLKPDTTAEGGTELPRYDDQTATQPNGTILPHTSTTGVFVPPRGRSFQKFSFDFPEPAVAFEGFSFGFLVFTYENAYGLDRERMTAKTTGGALEIECSQLVWAGGQERAPGRVRVRLRTQGDFVEWDADVEMDRPIKAVTTIIRGVPRGQISSGGAPFFDARDDEILLAYPFSGGDLFGPGGSGGLTTPLVLIKGDRDVFFISSLDDRVRTKRFSLQPGESAYRVEASFEAEGWKASNRLTMPTWRVGRVASVEAAASLHYEHLERAYRIPRWETRPDVPGWMRKTALAVTLHGQHYTGYIFNDYAAMLEILRWIATRMPAERALVFIAAWDGRYYWDYPIYNASARMGDEKGFATLIREGQELGFKMMPMFGANAANRRQPIYTHFADAFTEKIDGDRMDLNWVDWDNDRHQDGWLTYMNLGVDSWRGWMFDRIADCIDRYHPDAYFLDIVGGWINNPRADMHEGTRRLIADLRAKYPDVVGVGEMHYDALLEFIPMHHSFSQTLITSEVQKYARFFQHLSHPAPGRGSTGVHEAGFGRWNPQTLSLSEHQIPTLNIVDDTFTRYRAEMDAVIQRARQRVGI